jgi:hypothetical protein
MATDWEPLLAIASKLLDQVADAQEAELNETLRSLLDHANEHAAEALAALVEGFRLGRMAPGDRPALLAHDEARLADEAGMPKPRHRSPPRST